jgi:hypothetical protein
MVNAPKAVSVPSRRISPRVGTRCGGAGGAYIVQRGIGESGGAVKSWRTGRGNGAMFGLKIDMKTPNSPLIDAESRCVIAPETMDAPPQTQSQGYPTMLETQLGSATEGFAGTLCVNCIDTQ